MKKLITALLFGMVAVMAVSAQSLKHVYSGAMSGGTKFQIVYELNAAASSVGAINAPQIQGAKLIMASSPQQVGETSNTVIVNGRKIEDSHSYTYRYTLTYRIDGKPGKLQVGAASVNVGGKRVSSQPFTYNAGQASNQRNITLAQQVAAMSGGQVDINNAFSQTADKPISENDLYVRIDMSKPKVYEQEAVVCTIKLYTKFPIRPEIIPLKQPSFTGFLIEEIKEVGNVNVERVNGQNYYTCVLKKAILYPQQSGTLTINSGVFDITPVQRDVYVGLNSAIAVPHDTKLTVKSNSASVKIEPLPSPRPANFSGAVGDFTISDNIVPAQLKTYAASTYSVTVSGNGNLKYIKAPAIAFPKEFDTYEPQSKIDTHPTSRDVAGKVTFNYQFIPQYVGQFTIPASDFVYFNPSTGRYETLKLGARNLQVAKGSGKPSSHYKQQADAMTDIHGIHMGDLGLQKQHSFYLSSFGYWLCWIIPALLMVALLLYNRRLLKEQADERLRRSRRAGRVAQKRLKKARKFMAENKQNEFYAEVLTATWGYLSDKMNIALSDLNKDNIANVLDMRGAAPDLRDSVIALLDDCEFAQYAPNLAAGDMAAVLERAATVMERLQREIKKTPKHNLNMPTAILLLAMLLGGSQLAAAQNSAIAQADSAYQNEHYQQALQIYLQQASTTGTSSDLYYNIANSYYRMGNYAQAILYYERSLVLDPGNSDARSNLAFVRGKLKISEDTGSNFFNQLAMSIVTSLSSNKWAVLACVAFVLMLAALAAYIFSQQVMLRKVGFFGGLTLLVLMVLSLTCSVVARSQATHRLQAIVVVPTSTLSKAPHTPSPQEEAFRLIQGQKVTIQDSVSTGKVKWFHVETADARKAWISSHDIEKI